MSEDEKLRFLNILKRSLSYHFDILEDHAFYKYDFSLVAKAVLENYRTIFGTVKFDQFYSFEFVLVKLLDKNNLQTIKNAIAIIKNKHLELFTPSQDVIGTVITLIFISSLVDNKIISYIENFKYQKSFLLGLKGKYEIRLIFFDITQKKIYTNKKGVEVKNYYEKIFNKEVVNE